MIGFYIGVVTGAVAFYLGWVAYECAVHLLALPTPTPMKKAGFDHSIIHFRIGQHVRVKGAGDFYKGVICRIEDYPKGWFYTFRTDEGGIECSFWGDEFEAVG